MRSSPTPPDRMKKNRIKTLAGDRVTVEVSPYDLEKGRLIFRHKDERAGSASRAAATQPISPAVTRDARAQRRQRRSTATNGAMSMRLFIFKSDASPDLRAFGGDLAGMAAAKPVQALARDRRGRPRPGPAAQFSRDRDRNGDQRTRISAVAHEQKGRQMKPQALAAESMSQCRSNRR